MDNNLQTMSSDIDNIVTTFGSDEYFYGANWSKYT